MLCNYSLIYILFKKKYENTVSVIYSLLVWITNIYISILIFSGLNILNTVSVLLLYLLEDIFLLWGLYKHGEKKSIFSLIQRIKQSIIGIFIGKNSRPDGVILFIILWVFGLGIVAFFSVPYNYDSIMYHAPRIQQWVQNGTVSYYASHVMRQNASTVLAAYISTYFYILYGHHPGAMSLTQYFGYIVTLYFIIALCRHFKVTCFYKKCATILWITLPIAFAEAITQQNDLVAAALAISFVTYIYKISEGKFNNKKVNIIVLAAYMGYAFITKPNVCLLMSIFLVVYLSICINRKYGVTEILLQIVVAILIIALICTPQMLENYSLQGTLFSSMVGQKQLIGTLIPSYVFVNWLKNILYNFGFNWGSFSNLGIIQTIVRMVSTVLNVEMNHPAIAENGIDFIFPTIPNYSSDAALQNTLMTVMLITVVLMILKRKIIDSERKTFAILSIASFVLFCVILRWETSITRYMTAFFAVIIVGCIIVFDDIHSKGMIPKFVEKTIIVVIALMVLIDITCEIAQLYKFHPVFPVKSSLTLYSDRYEEYLDVAKIINEKADSVGIIEGETSVEYPFWLMIEDGIIINHVNVENVSAVYEDRDYHPDIIISDINLELDQVECHGEEYDLVYRGNWWNAYSNNE